jgi:hypothetical protein
MKKGLWIVIALLLVSVTVNVFLWYREPDMVKVLERDTIWKDMAIYQPSPVDSKKIGRVVYIKVPITKHDTLRDTIRDSILAPVPIMQKRYEDSLYTAWVSGFQPNLDSIRLYQPEVTNTVTKYVERPMQRLNIGASVGAGYGIINKKPDIFVGVTLTWNLGKRKK